MILEGLEVGPFMSNTFIAGCEETRDAILFDTGADPDRILKWVKSKGLNVKEIIATHGHVDHIGAVQEVKKALGVKFRIHKNDELLVKAYNQQCQMFGIRFGEEPEIDGFLEEGEEITIGNIKGVSLFTPGHSPGGMCFSFPGKVVVGDTLFQSSIGRTDLFGGDHNLLISKIKTQLFTLENNTEVFCGHGPKTTIGAEKLTNPFLG